MTAHTTQPRRALAKIVATLGPASDSPDVVRRLIEGGVSVFRLNFSHGTLEGHGAKLTAVRQAAAALGRTVAVLGDLCGPKIRVGAVPDPGIMLEAGSEVVFPREIETARTEKRDRHQVTFLPTQYPPMVDEVEPGDRVLINDGAIRMLATESGRSSGALRCHVTVGGLVTSGKGINLPETNVSAHAVTERDLECARWAVENGLDYLALSFVRRSADIAELRAALLEYVGGDPAQLDERGWIPIVAKIEKPQAIDDLDSIINAADAIMVARGDLGVEVDVARVPLIQKQILRACAARGKPCIVATQMLESMITSAVPTRAEATDVANAIIDGADAVMLSGETAAGKHPALVVETMRRIVEVTEAELARMPHPPSPPTEAPQAHRGTRALAHGAAQIAADLGARVIACWSERGGTARYLSQNDLSIPILAFSSSEANARRMCLYGGVFPVCAAPPASGTLREWNQSVDAILIERQFASLGDPIVLVAGRPLGVAKSTNTIAIHRVGEESAGFRDS